MRHTLFVLTASTLLAGGELDVAAPSMCSLAPFSLWRQVGTTYFVGRALPESLLVGQGEVEPTRYGGHWGAGSERPVYGQVVRVIRLRGHEQEALEQAFASRGSRDVIVVPWDYDPECAPTFWSRSASWISTDAPGSYAVRLRPKQLWKDGQPVFDAFMAGLTPYPHGPFYERGYRGTDALRLRPSLSADEFFDFQGAWPFFSSPRDYRVVRDSLINWSRRHPELAGKYPAADLIAKAERAAARQNP